MSQPPIDHEALRQRFNPEGSLLRRMQHRMTEMLVEIDKICRRHDLKYWLCSGTLLGCVRHGGYIPWDDDLDIEMLREDYEKLWPTKYLNYSPGIPYPNTILPQETFPLTTAMFDGVEVPVPADTDAYLRRKFGNYMQLPPLDNIHPHSAKLTIND